MTPQEFVDKWRDVVLKERSFYQEHFIDLCHLVGHQTPAAFDPTARSSPSRLGLGAALPMCGNRAFFAGEYKGTRTLTNLYNQRPTWLDLAHQKLGGRILTRMVSRWNSC